MTKFLRSAALVAALLTCALALPAQATSSIGTGTLTAVSDDVNVGVNGAYNATAVVTLFGTFTATVTFEQTLDGTNWIPSAYAQRTDAVSANPSSGATATAAGTYEIPLPANAQGVRARCSAYTSGTVNAQVRPGRPYQPGVPVTAVLYDSTGAAGAALDTGTLDVSGWTQVPFFVSFTFGSANGGWSLRGVDDTGAFLSITASPSQAASNTWWGGIGPGLSNPLSTTQLFPMPRRINFNTVGATGGVFRFHVEARR